MERVVPHYGGKTVAGTALSPEQWQNDGKWFNYGNHAIFSRIMGEGEPLVLLHGFPTASWDYSLLWPLFNLHKYRLLTLDMLGFGFSDKPVNYAYSIEDQADLQQGWIEALCLKNVHLLAHDYGCSVAQELLAREQEGLLRFRIASVCFLNGALFPEVHRPMMIQRLLSSPIGGLLSRGLTRSVFDANFCRLFSAERRPSQQELDNFWQLLTYNNGRGVLHRLIHYMEERRCHRNRWVQALQSAQQPMRLVSGTADPVSGAAMALRYRELVPSPDVVSLRGVGHYPHYESPAEVFRAFREFHQSFT
ncbi:alpha/beta fold hydrolase [Marinobacter salicampi]|uniref:alpha/beta fold hydrolase n=1 Tax=Marinobacter salicampi TaxID=435907 RepID=UPI00140A1617|nr:alpha/beta hydrolase [Marinobacter salicampi]